MALEWLVNYGVRQHSFNPDDLDVLDKMHLQEQINSVRKNYSEALKLLDEVQGRYVEVCNQLNQVSKRLTQQSLEENVRLNVLLSVDDEQLQLEAEQKALSAGISMINAQIDFWKNDLRVLNNVFYSKF